MDVLVKILAAAVAGSALGLVIKQHRPEMSLLLTIAMSIFALYLSFDVLATVLRFLGIVAETAGIPNATLAIVLKTAGVSLITKFVSDVCREAGQGAAATGVEFAGAATSVYIALPLFETVLDMLKNLL